MDPNSEFSAPVEKLLIDEKPLDLIGHYLGKPPTAL
jgi:hypothetical protein